MKNSISSIGVIMDGNRRWAKKNGKNKTDGHRQGLDTLTNLLEWSDKESITDVCVYAFSSENWSRPQTEVDALMDLFREVLTDRLDELFEKGGRVRFVGDLSRFPDDIQKLINDAHARKTDTKKTLWIAASYGGRSEIQSAADDYLQAKGEGNISDYLWTAKLPDPEIIIRTGGNNRLSNFLLWGAAYSELFFTDTLWPDFSKDEFKSILTQYRDTVSVNKGV